MKKIFLWHLFLQFWLIQFQTFFLFSGGWIADQFFWTSLKFDAKFESFNWLLLIFWLLSKEKRWTMKVVYLKFQLQQLWC